jgi:L,D-peptidoglycan transpeptidase YkuD (ErfK/YbiS/YcfS/YnhG family)
MIPQIRVSATHLHLPDGSEIPCSVGKAGLVHTKQEGDGGTPIGRFPMRICYYRPDRLRAPETGLHTFPLSPYDGWCDDPSHAEYNQHVKLPFDARHEQLWREDHAYDIIIPLGYNDGPIEKGKGSAIFFHVMHDDGRPTEGCVAINIADMLALLPQLNAHTEMVICT